MFLQSKKVLPWTGKNYFVSILNFVIHTLIMTGIAIGVTFINAGGGESFLSYVSQGSNLIKYAYLGGFVSLLNAAVYLYFYYEFKDYLLKVKNITVLFLILYLSYILTFVLGNYVGIYARPIALCALFVLLLINKRTAVFMNFIFAIFVFLTDVMTNQPFTVMQASSSMIMTVTISIVAVYLIDGTGSRIKVFGMGLVISVPISVIALILEVETLTDYRNLLTIIFHSFTGGLSSVVIMMAALPIFEYLFNILTNYRLAEITDHKSKLIKRMKDEAWGTFNHSTVVASLAETCAAAIEENPILARAAAYYHDIGKLKQPIYFTENQDGKYNPHDDLTPELSTEIIRSHTRDGYELIKKYHLPIILADVAREHHGTLPIQYFYMKALKYTEGELDINDFCYPGPKPHSKIAAIIMLADGCEAAVRAHNDRSREKVEMIVDSIVEDRMKREQFSDCDITMHEIDLIRDAIVNGLSGVYHDRIKYPKMPKTGKNAFSSSSDRSSDREEKKN